MALFASIERNGNSISRKGFSRGRYNTLARFENKIGSSACRIQSNFHAVGGDEGGADRSHQIRMFGRLLFVRIYSISFIFPFEKTLTTLINHVRCRCGVRRAALSSSFVVVVVLVCAVVVRSNL